MSIHDRLQAAADRAVPGHWEGDLISGSANTHIATLVERKSRYTVLAKIRGKDTNSVISGTLREVGKLPDTLWESITWDRGDEIADHKRLKSKKILMFVSLTHRAHGKEERTKLQIAY